MSSTETLLQHLAEVEAEKELLRSQLSARKRSSQGGLQRQKTDIHISSEAGSSSATLNKVTGWLDRSTKQSSHSPLLDIFTQYDQHRIVFDNIYQRLDIKAVIAISRTCKRLSSFYSSMLPCRWNINRRLARFVDDPKEFRSRLGQADALISGTFALLFFAQLYWLDSGMDIYVRQGSKADNLIRYIGADKSYKFEYSYGWSDDDQHRTLTKKVLIFREIGPPGSPQIRFHLTRTSPLHSILTDCAFSTAHVNFITWNKAYCMFPNVTFLDRRMYFLHNPDEAMGQILSKYSAHGWRTSNWVDYDQAKGCNKAGIREKSRRVGDSSTWVIPLNLYKIRTPECSDSVIESCSFQIFPDSGPQESRHAVTGLKTFGIGAQTFSCCMLKHIYTFHAPDISWIVFLREKLSRMIVLEILKGGDTGLIAKARQPNFTSVDYKCCPLLEFRPRFQRPDGWETVDHMVPVWFEEWKTARRDETGSIDLKPHPLNVARSKKQLGESPTKVVDSLPPPIPPRARSMTTSRLPSNAVPAPLSSSKSEQFPLSLRTTTARLPRSVSVSQMNQSTSVQAKLPTLVSPTRRIVSAQSKPSKPGCLLPRGPAKSFSLSNQHSAQPSILRHEQSQKPPLARSATLPHLISPQDLTPPRSPEKQKVDYFSLIHRRPKAPVPPPLDLSPTKFGPLLHGLPTPPPDVPLPAIPVKHRPKRSPLNFPSHLPWSPFEKKFHSSHSNGSLSSVSAGSEKVVPGEMNWL
ncbi:hypothetical protein E4T48_06411 [Aureobasidium sp. EXF-10727]|nr:hypothetical protein E4T48_06411 [Aureobasidium sp. EXF-10727]KAI4725270.1 hypothetical protein E4T49_06992 [Aureobasidium sp. EXF-10728]